MKVSNIVLAQAAETPVANGPTLALGGDSQRSRWWMRLAALLPLAVLLAGLVLIQQRNSQFGWTPGTSNSTTIKKSRQGERDHL